MIITDKDGNVHSIKIERITFGVINTLLGVIELKIYFRDNGYSLSINFASKEAAESVLKQIDTRMEAIRNHWNPTHNVPILESKE